MHLDWVRLSLSGYFEALEAHNESAGGESTERAGGDPDRLRRFVEAHKRGLH